MIFVTFILSIFFSCYKDVSDYYNDIRENESQNVATTTPPAERTLLTNEVNAILTTYFQTRLFESGEIQSTTEVTQVRHTPSEVIINTDTDHQFVYRTRNDGHIYARSEAQLIHLMRTATIVARIVPMQNEPEWML